MGTLAATNTENIDINLQFNKKGYSPFRGYLDYIRLQVKRNLALYNNQVVFRVLDSSSKTVVAYNLGGIPDNLKVWDVTNFDQPMAMRTVGSSFTDSTNGQIKEYLGFTGSNFPVPSMASKVANQNLKGLPSSDLIIISNPSLLEQAERLATFRRSNDGLRVSVVTT